MMMFESMELSPYEMSAAIAAMRIVARNAPTEITDKDVNPMKHLFSALKKFETCYQTFLDDIEKEVKNEEK